MPMNILHSSRAELQSRESIGWNSVEKEKDWTIEQQIGQN